MDADKKIKMISILSNALAEFRLVSVGNGKYLWYYYLHDTYVLLQRNRNCKSSENVDEKKN